MAEAVIVAAARSPIGRAHKGSGAAALGHPFGSTGARLTTTLVHGLQERDGHFGVEAIRTPVLMAGRPVSRAGPS